MGFPFDDSLSVLNDMSELPAWELDGPPNDPIDPIFDWVEDRKEHVCGQ